MDYSNHPQDIARREGVRRGAALSALVTAVIASGIFIVLHTALKMSDENNAARIAKMDREASALLLDTCRRDLSRYADIARLEQDVVAHMEGRR